MDQPQRFSPAECLLTPSEWVTKGFDNERRWIVNEFGEFGYMQSHCLQFDILGIGLETSCRDLATLAPATRTIYVSTENPPYLKYPRTKPAFVGQ